MDAFIDILGNKISEVGISYIPFNDIDVFQYVFIIWTSYLERFDYSYSATSKNVIKSKVELVF